MPIFRFNKALNMARDTKVFLNLQSGVTRGAVPDDEWYKRQAEKLRNARQHIKEQRKTLKSKDQELRNARQHIKEQRKTLKSKDQEIFQLKNELLAAKELPDFVIIGAAKCGTTSLYRLLTRHPHIALATSKDLHSKDLNFFDIHFEKGIEWYRLQFPLPVWREGRRSITGEASADYMSHPHAARRMAEVVPQARLIALLRNPVDRAYSHYHHNRSVPAEGRRRRDKKGCETLEFEEAIEVEQVRLRGEKEKMLEDEQYVSFNYRHFSYLERGIYVDQLLRWSKFFSDEQMLVLKSEDFFEHPTQTLKLVLDFLELPDWEPEGVEQRNKGHYEQEMDPVTRRRLEEYFEPHNRRLYEYLGRDFGW